MTSSKALSLEKTQKIFWFSSRLFVPLHPIMMIELHNVTIGERIRNVSATVENGQLLCLTGAAGTGKTTLVRAIMGFIPIDGGHISIDGELLTPQSAPYFRRQTAYVPQHLSLPEGYTDISTDYISLLTRAVHSEKPLLIIDEPQEPLDEYETAKVDSLLEEAVNNGKTVFAVNDHLSKNRISL